MRGRGFWGKVWGYVATVVLVVIKPGMLAGEERRRVSGRAGRRFYGVSLFLATVIGVEAGYWIENREGVLRLEWGATTSLWSAMQVLRDSWWELALLGVGIFWAWRWMGVAYRWMALVGNRGVER